MERTNLGKDIQPELSGVLNYIMDNALGSILELSSDPTTSGGELETNQAGFNPTTSKLFINLSGTTYSISLVAV